MPLEINNLYKQEIPQEWLEQMEEVLPFYYAQEDIPVEAIIGLTFCDDDYIAEINQDYRDKAQSTDVLSFPMFEPDEVIESMAGEALLLGDILISVPHVYQQSQAYGHAPLREALYLFVHGLLHLAGYDHMDDQEKQDMRAQEEKLLQAIAVTRDLPVEEDIRALLSQAKQAASYAYAPYSYFKVGAALQAKDGKIFTACNVENASYGLSSCAERNALFKAISEGEKDFTAIAIVGTGTEPVVPCGACRQVLAEFSPEIKVIMGSLESESSCMMSMADLLPHSFVLEQGDKV